MIATVLSFGVSLGISFFLSPYMVKTLGAEVYGFIPLINNFINIMQIVTVAINSMASRFITISFFRKEYEKANKYFSSVLIANIVICVILIIPVSFVILFVDKVFSVPAGYLRDVQISFAILMLNFVISVSGSVFSVGTFVANRLELSSLRSIVAQSLRAFSIIALFLLFNPSIVLVVISTFSATIYTVVTNMRLTKKLVPELKISRRNFDKNSIKELFGAGVWNSIGTLSYDLFTGLDLMIANIFISATAMGVLSVSKTLPSTINALVSTIVSVFMPSLTQFYAKGEKQKILDAFTDANKIMLLFIAPILSFLIGFGDKFYSLWMPTLDSTTLQILSICAILPLYLCIGSKGLANIFAVVNKIKVPTLVTLGLAVASTTTVFILLNFTQMGIYAIAIVSAVYLVIKEMIFVPIYSAKCLNVPFMSLFINVIKCAVIVVICSAISYIFSSMVDATDWLSLIEWGIISSVAICAFILLTLFKKSDYMKLLSKIKRNKKA